MVMKFSSRRPLTDEEEAEIQRMIASDPDNPEITEEQAKELRPFAEVFPELAEAMAKEIGDRRRAESANRRSASASTPR